MKIEFKVVRTEGELCDDIEMGKGQWRPLEKGVIKINVFSLLMAGKESSSKCSTLADGTRDQE